MTTFRLASTRTYSNASGERQQETEWFSVIAWRQLAEQCNQYLTKGQRAYVEGRLRSRTWAGQDGQPRFRNEIVADRVLFLDRPPAPQAPETRAPETRVSSEEEAPATTPDELPF
jgi:single-strand DNA-binding protein